MTNTDDLRYEGKPSHVIAKSILFAVNKDEWETRKDTGKSMRNALYVLRYAKRHLSSQSDVKQGKNHAIALAIKPLLSYACLKASVSQLLTYSVSRKFH